MCIIAIKEAGTPFPSVETMTNCFRSNSDGAGLMYNTGTHVIIKKGLMTLDSFLVEYAKHAIPENIDKTYVLHFRIATHGKKDATMTHPFPVTKSEEFLTLPHVRSKYGFAHNGILMDMGDHESLSDSALYVSRYLSKINLEDSDLAKYFLMATTPGSRTVVLYPDGSSIASGDWQEDKTTGVWYSNGTYKSLPVYDRYDWQYWRRDVWDYEDDDKRYADWWQCRDDSSGRTKRLPHGLKVYSEDGLEYSQSSQILDKGEWFELGDDGSMFVCHYDMGVLVKEFFDYVTHADGTEVVL